MKYTYIFLSFFLFPSLLFASETVSRSEFLQYVGEEFFPEEMEEFSQDFSQSSFVDVGVNNHPVAIELAKSLGIVRGFSDDIFRPEKEITRSEAAKILLIAAGFSGSFPSTEHFSDVSEDAWFFGFVEKLHALCILTEKNYRPHDALNIEDMQYFFARLKEIQSGKDLCHPEEKVKEVSFAPSRKKKEENSPIKKESDSITSKEKNDDASEKNILLPEEEKQEVTILALPEPQKTTTSLSHEGVFVAIDPNSPLPRKIPLNASNVPFLKFQISAPETEDALVTHLFITRSGLGKRQDIESVKAFVGFQKYGATGTFSSRDQETNLNLSSNPIRIAKGTTEVITIVADMSAKSSGSDHQFLLANERSLTILGAETGNRLPVEGDFPIQSGHMSTSNVETGTLQIEYLPVSSTLYVGLREAELARIRLSGKGSTEDVLIQSITITYDGITDGDIENTYLSLRGERISPVVIQTSEQKAYFDLAASSELGGLIINKGHTKTIEVIGNIRGFIGSGLRVSIDDPASDIISKGLTTGFSH